MKTTVVQTKNVAIDVKERAEKRAVEAGYNSIQDVIRIFLIDVANGRFPLKLAWGDGLDPEVQKSLEDYRNGRYTTIAPNEDIDKILSS